MRAHCRSCDREQIVPFTSDKRGDYQCTVCGRPLTARPKKPAKSLKRSAPRKRRTAISPASTQQRAKVRLGACVVCGVDHYEARVDPAHVIPRGIGGCDHEDCIVPLCRDHHRAYDDGDLDLLPHLEPHYRMEIAHAIEHVGLISALERITNSRWREEEAA